MFQRVALQHHRLFSPHQWRCPCAFSGAPPSHTPAPLPAPRVACCSPCCRPRKRSTTRSLRPVRPRPPRARRCSWQGQLAGKAAGVGGQLPMPAPPDPAHLPTWARHSGPFAGCAAGRHRCEGPVAAPTKTGPTGPFAGCRVCGSVRGGGGRTTDGGGEAGRAVRAGVGHRTGRAGGRSGGVSGCWAMARAASGRGRGGGNALMG